MGYQCIKFKVESLLGGLKQWKHISAPSFVLDIVKHGVTIPFLSTPKPFFFNNTEFTGSQRKFLDVEIPRLLSVGVISMTPFRPLGVSSLTCVTKKSNKWRLCLNLQHLNQFVDTPKFSCENIDTVANYIQFDDRLVTCDLESGFLHVKVNEAHRQYLGFQYRGKFYVYNTLVFGLSCSPYYFHKLLRPVVGYLRSTHNIRVCLYVDDWLLLANSKDITDHTDTLVHTLQDLGLCINFEKSDLSPSTRKEYIGFIVDSRGPNKCPWILVPHKKLVKLKSCIKNALKKDCISARVLARICGICISMTKAIIPAKLKLRNAYRLLATKKSWSDLLVLSNAARQDLEWWLNALITWNGAPIQVKSPQLQIATDASGSGWGGLILQAEVREQVGLSASGTWPECISQQPSNYRELLAIILTLGALKQVVKGKCVRILSDNVSAVAYLNHMGGPSIDLSDLAQSLWAQCFEMNITVTAKYLAGKDNIQADSLSRMVSHYEWQLHPRVFRMIDQIHGPHSVDRFASIMTTQVERYNSRFHDPKTEAVDALAQSWIGENNFVNCPFKLIPRVLTLVCQQGVEATILAPWWPAQPWFQTLKRLAVCPPFKLPHNERTFIPMTPKCPEPLKNRNWRIFVWRINGKNY